MIKLTALYSSTHRSLELFIAGCALIRVSISATNAANARNDAKLTWPSS